MISPISPSLFRNGDAASKMPASAKASAASFTRHTPSQSSRSAISAGEVKVKDRGGINPSASSYGQIQSTAQTLLASGHFSNGVQATGLVRLGATLNESMNTHHVHAQAVGDEVHTVIAQNHVPVHIIRFAPSAHGGARVFLNGQELSPNSPLTDLQLVEAVTFGS
jgi:hypothetical protein